MSIAWEKWLCYRDATVCIEGIFRRTRCHVGDEVTTEAKIQALSSLRDLIDSRIEALEELED